ncbi:MAG: NAD-dependent epimerase/dehydratase family protein [Nitrospinae bacterium]|nr:NAD-dependent epimerase/dehydratase family protein [Nitrospinota bacterium]
MAETNHHEGPALVTGASGFIGRHLVRALLRQNRRVLALCRSLRDLQGLEHPLFRVIHGDLEEPQSYAAHLNDQVTVFHLAATRNSPGTSPERLHRINVEACLDLGRVSVKARIAKFVYVSTATVFGPSKVGSVTEDDGYCRHTLKSIYLRSKVRALVQMGKLLESGLPLVTVCPTIVFGPDHPTHPNRVTSYLRRLLRSRLDLVVGGGHRRRNLVYVDDAVRGMLLAERSGGLGEEYILGGEEISHRELNRTVLSLAGRKPRLRLSIPVTLARATAKVADRLRGYDRGTGYETALEMLTKEWEFSSQKAENMLGYTPMPLRDTIRQTLRFVEGAN